MDEKNIQFRATCDQYITKCERIFNQLKPYNKIRFREMFYEKDKEIPSSLLLKDLSNHYLTENLDLKLKTRSYFRGISNVLETYKKGNSVVEITPILLIKFEKN